MADWRLIVADCVEAMRSMEPDSISAVVCDPPYDLTGVSRNGSPRQNDPETPFGRHRLQSAGGFMGQRWDATGVAFDPETWRAVMRVMRPGAFLVSFGGTRTHHRLMCAIEDAGFEIRDTIGHMHAGPSLGVYAWTHAQGFPKGKDFAKDDAASRAAGHRVPRPEFVGTPFEEGWNVALKPAWEIIVLARKPLIGSVAENVARYGTGGINVDATRVATTDKLGGGDQLAATKVKVEGWDRPWMHDAAAKADHAARVNANVAKAEALGRWPSDLVITHHPDCLRLGTRRVASQAPTYRRDAADAAKDDGVIYGRIGPQPSGKQIGYADADGTEETARYACVPECPIRLLDAQAGERPSGGGNKTRAGRPERSAWRDWEGRADPKVRQTNDFRAPDTGGASRFFPTFAWAAGEVEEATRFRYQSKASTRERGCGLPDGMTNTNPCVKPVALLRWITRLVCPPNGTVLDPFAGSGSEGMACLLEGFDYVGVEMSEEYAAIARARLAHVERHGERWLEMATGGADRSRVGALGTKTDGDSRRKVLVCPACERRWHSAATTCERCGVALEWRDEQAERERRGEGRVYAGGKGLGYTVPRCPEHGESLPSGQNAYRCGCKIVRLKPADDPRRAVPRHNAPSAVTPEPGRVYAGGKGRRKVPHCPEHDMPRGPNNRFYRCGCRLRYETYEQRAARSAARHDVPSDGTPDYADLPLWHSVRGGSDD